MFYILQRIPSTFRLYILLVVIALLLFLLASPLSFSLTLSLLLLLLWVPAGFRLILYLLPHYYYHHYHHLHIITIIIIIIINIAFISIMLCVCMYVCVCSSYHQPTKRTTRGLSQHTWPPLHPLPGHHISNLVSTTPSQGVKTSRISMNEWACGIYSSTPLNYTPCSTTLKMLLLVILP